MSDYHIATTDKADDLANVLSRSLGTKGNISNTYKIVGWRYYFVIFDTVINSYAVPVGLFSISSPIDELGKLVPIESV